ncbi:MAG: cell division protein FtsZ [Nanoarchaeota archaeon]
MDSIIQRVFENEVKNIEPVREPTRYSPVERVQETNIEPQKANSFSYSNEISAGEPAAYVVPNETPKNADQDIMDEFGLENLQAKILVLGVGGAGNNCVTRLTEMGVKGADTIAVNTDAKHLSISKSDKKVLIGRELTRGLGAGGYPITGKKAAEESEKQLKKILEGCDMLYLVCGLGGGTGTGAAPVIAQIAKDMGAIVIGCVTLPFKIEGARMGKAEDGLYHLRQVCDTVMVIENDRLLKIAGDLPLQQAFGVADNLISTIIKGVTETIATPSLVNLDYADVRTIMHSGGVASVGFGESDTKNRAEESVTRAMANPLLEVNYEGGTGALIHITGGEDLKLDEVNLIGEYVSRQLDPEAQVIWGSRIDPTFKGKIRVITIVTGIKSPYILGPLAQEEAAHRDEFAKDLGIPVIGK